MAQTTTILITGVKSGIGKALLTTYLARDNYLVIAAIRDGPDSEPAKTLEALPTGKNTKIIVVKYDAGSKESNEAMVQDLKDKHNVTSLDIVIANAGILKHWGPVREVKIEDLSEHLSIHTFGPILLYQVTAPLLDKSKQTPKFFIISSSLGSNGLMDDYAPMQMIAYNMAKSAINHAAGRIHREEEKMVIVPVQPGWIATDMGSRAAVWAGMNEKDPPVKLEDSVAGITSLVDRATKEEHSGKFWDATNGKQLPW